MCLDGFQPCPGGVPKCFSNDLTVPSGMMCTPIESAHCGGGGGGGGGGGSGDTSVSDGGQGDAGAGAPAPDSVSEPLPSGDGSTSSDGGPGPAPTDSDAEIGDGGGGGGGGGETIVPSVFPPDFVVWPMPHQCTTCASAAFKCYEANCRSWSCEWWCRCYDENTEYTCEDDGDDCDCGAFGAELWDVTYDELLQSLYMDVMFAG